MTGWHRDHARKAIRTALVGKQTSSPRQPREPVRRYDDAAVALLARCWAVLDGPTGKRLRPALPGLIANLSAHGHLTGTDPAAVDQVLAMSAATIDRRLADARTGLVARKPISHTRPGSLLKSSIPMKTWREWNDTEPGFVQIDLVGHEGGDNNGAFFYSLDATDIATGWTETVTVRSKGERIVSAGLEELRLRFPFHIAGIHSDIHTDLVGVWVSPRDSDWSAEVTPCLLAYDTATTPLERLLNDHPDLVDPHDTQRLTELVHATTSSPSVTSLPTSKAT